MKPDRQERDSCELKAPRQINQERRRGMVRLSGNDTRKQTVSLTAYLLQEYFELFQLSLR